MKNIVLVILLFWGLNLSAQIGERYEMIRTFELEECRFNGDKTGNKEVINSGTDFIVEHILNNGDYIIHIVKYTGNSEKSQNLNNRLVFQNSDDKRYKLFLIGANHLNIFRKKELLLPKHSFAVGLTTIPIKLRFGSKDKEKSRYFDFTGEVNLGLSAGYKLRLSRTRKFAINFLVGFNITSIEVDSSSTQGEINEDTKVAAFTPSLNVILETNNVQFGLYTGIDFLPGVLGTRWVYRNQPWLGIGIGYGLFSSKGKEKQNLPE